MRRPVICSVCKANLGDHHGYQGSIVLREHVLANHPDVAKYVKEIEDSIKYFRKAYGSGILRLH
jgi:hypothetical protein